MLAFLLGFNGCFRFGELLLPAAFFSIFLRETTIQQVDHLPEQTIGWCDEFIVVVFGICFGFTKLVGDHPTHAFIVRLGAFPPHLTQTFSRTHRQASNLLAQLTNSATTFSRSVLSAITVNQVRNVFWINQQVPVCRVHTVTEIIKRLDHRTIFVVVLTAFEFGCSQDWFTARR
ncbi:hypothetical protein D3C71_866980 [compost metagenome]